MKMDLIRLLCVSLLQLLLQKADCIDTIRIADQKPMQQLQLWQNQLEDLVTSTVNTKKIETNQEALRDSFARNIADMLFSKMTALAAIQRHTRDAYTTAHYDKNFHFLNARIENNKTRVVSHFWWDIKIDLNASYAYIPYDMYDRTEGILTTAKYSKALDKTFIENYRQDDTITWQYFCSPAGVWRNYPGLWKNKYT